MVYGENEGEVFLGRSITTHKNVSEATMQKVDAEIRRIIDQQYALARRLLEENRDKVEAMTKALLEWETIDAEQMNDIMAGKPPRRPSRHRRRARRQRPPDNTPAPAPRRRRLPGSLTRNSRAVLEGAGHVLTPFFFFLRFADVRFDENSVRMRAPRGPSPRLDRPLVMGIVNVTPDSFSDGGRFFDVRHARRARGNSSPRARTCSMSAASPRGRGGSRFPGRGTRRACPGVEALAPACRCRRHRKPEVMRAASPPARP
jgi:hypothetical protein